MFWNGSLKCIYVLRVYIHHILWGQEEKGTTEDEMAGWLHGLDGRESEWTPGDGDGQGGLACCDSWGRKELDTTERLNWTDIIIAPSWSSYSKNYKGKCVFNVLHQSFLIVSNFSYRFLRNSSQKHYFLTYFTFFPFCLQSLYLGISLTGYKILVYILPSWIF